MKTKNIYLFIILFVCGCQTQKKQKTTINMPPPPPPPSITPPSPPPNFIPDREILGKLKQIKEIQINRLPHPFNLNGNNPYVIWVDGKRLALNSHEVRHLAKVLNLHFTQPEDTAEIHNGEGWQYPKKIKFTEKIPPLKNNFVDKEEKFNSPEPEIFIDN